MMKETEHTKNSIKIIKEEKETEIKGKFFLYKVKLIV